MTPKYLVAPGPITSINDRQSHFISAAQLMRLYRVDPKDCIVLGGDRDRGIYGTFVLLEPQYRPEEYQLSRCPSVKIERGDEICRFSRRVGEAPCSSTYEDLRRGRPR